MQTFIIGLLLACVSGVTVVAFKHPYGYARLFPYVLAVATFVFVAITIWHVAVEVSWHNLKVFIVAESAAGARSATERLGLPYVWVLFWFLAVIGFLWVNLKLPPFLQGADKNDEQNNSKDSR